MSLEKLKTILLSIDNRPYPAYKDIRGEYHFPLFTLFIDYVQGDPFAAPSRLRVVVPKEKAGFPGDTHENKSRETALRDFLARAFAWEAEKHSDHRGSGKSGLIAIETPLQQILERSSVLVHEGDIEARFAAGLPARGRKVLGLQASDMLCNNLPEIVERALLYENIDRGKLAEHLDCAEDADTARALLSEHNLCAFIADGSILPRRSGVDDRPLADKQAVPFTSPESLSVTLPLPHAGKVTGMGIPRGVTLIAGGGYHGKSTLLRAIEQGVYDHVPGDGRERVVTDGSAFKIRAEDGRSIATVDISSFIENLPDGTDTTSFSTQNASGSTSQAANIIEALESSCTLLLLDEDTCATNFMIRDRRMQDLVEKTGEPITPFIDRVRGLFEDQQVSSILVMGGSGDYFEVADKVLLMDRYHVTDVTGRARSIAQAHDLQRLVEVQKKAGKPKERIPDPDSIDSSKGRHPAKINPKGLAQLLFGRHTIDVGCVEQLVDRGQLRAIGQAVYFARNEFMNSGEPLSVVAEKVDQLIREKSLDAIDRRKQGDFVIFRKQEFLAVLNRLRTLQIRTQ